jgi:hypothetical protein
MHYNARLYDPALGRFVSADTIVPGSASGSMQSIAAKPLTVAFHEGGFLGKLNQESGAPFWFQLGDTQRQQLGSPFGPVNPQALNRYSYVQNNPVKYTDPSGHSVYLTHDEAVDFANMLNKLADKLESWKNTTDSISDIATALEALLGIWAKAIPAATLAAVITQILANMAEGSLDAIVADLRKMAGWVEHFNGDSGVIIGAACWRRLYTCEISILSRDTGNGVVYTTQADLFAKGFWNAFYSVSSTQYFEPGRACTIEGENPSGKRWKRDTRWCKPHKTSLPVVR